MTPIQETVASMALVTLRQRHAASAIGVDEIRAAVRDCMKLLSQDWPDEQVAEIVSDLETKLVIKVGKATLLADKRGHVPWYFGERKADRRFFRRYADFLLHNQGWPPIAVDAIDETTDLGPRLIKSTIPELRRGRQKRDSFAPACRSGLRCGGSLSAC